MTKKWRWSILIGLAVVGLILGSFLDLQFSQAIYSKGNWFGIAMAAFGAAPIYMCMSAFGVAYILFALRKETVTWLKVILWALAIGCIGAAIYFQADMIMSKNAFDIEHMWYVGYPVGLVIAGIGCVIGYFLFKNVTDQKALITLIAVPVILLISILCVDIVKRIMARPRFRFLVASDNVASFMNWWESGAGFKDNLIAHGYDPKVLKEEFRSFPSGHTVTTTSLVPFLAFLPRIDERLKKAEPYLFYGAIAWAALMAFSRILIGAHFLSDVSMGALICSVVSCIVDIFVLRNPKEEPALATKENVEINKENIVEELHDESELNISKTNERESEN